MAGRHRPRRRSGRSAVAVALALGAACGSVGDPRPPLLNLARPVADFEARQVGDTVEIAWSWPVTTTEGTAARRIGGFTLWAVDVPGFSSDLAPETIDEYRKQVLTLELDDLPGRAPGDRIEVRSPLADWRLGQTSVLVVTVWNRSGRDAGYSNQVRIHPLQPPAALAGSAATVEPVGVELSWQASDRAEEYAVERATGDETAFQSLGSLSDTSFLDRTAVRGETYRYRLRPLRLSLAGTIEGPVSEELTVTAEDSFAPTPPEDLRAVRAASSVELSWLPSPEEDVAGYLVVRNEDVISPLVTRTTYSDRSAPLDEHLEYAVKAVDETGNESGPGTVAAVSPRDSRRDRGRP